MERLEDAGERDGAAVRVRDDPIALDQIFQFDPVAQTTYERADITSNSYYDWFVRNAYLVMAAQGVVAEFLGTFKEFPPRQKAASFTIDQVMAKMENAIAGSGR